jgi:hypothetical protein
MKMVHSTFYVGLCREIYVGLCRTAVAIWNSYLGGSGAYRPFGNAVLDGVDFDMEKGNGQYVVDFIDRLNGEEQHAQLCQSKTAHLPFDSQQLI